MQFIIQLAQKGSLEWTAWDVVTAKVLTTVLTKQLESAPMAVEWVSKVKIAPLLQVSVFFSYFLIASHAEILNKIWRYRMFESYIKIKPKSTTHISPGLKRWPMVYINNMHSGRGHKEHHDSTSISPNILHKLVFTDFWFFIPVLTYAVHIHCFILQKGSWDVSEMTSMSLLSSGGRSLTSFRKLLLTALTFASGINSTLLRLR